MTQLYQLPKTLNEDIAAHEDDIREFRGGRLEPDPFKARRVPRGIYEQRVDDTYMLRVRVAGGVVLPAQAALLAELARVYSGGRLHITTRQDIQLHGVRIEDTPAIMRRLLEVGLASKGGGGNTVRNVTACPYAAVCPHACFDVTPFAFAATEYLLGLGGSYALPRKFKIAFSGCATDCALAAVNDIGMVATVRDGQPGFVVLGGGGMGAASRLGQILVPFLPVQDAARAAEVGRRLFDRLGDRTNRARARLRFAVDKIGFEAFQSLFMEEMENVRRDSGVPDAPSAVPFAPLPSTGRRPTPERHACGLWATPQRQQDRCSVRLFPDLGDIAADDLAALGEIAAEWSADGGFRTHQGQGIVLPGVATTALPGLAQVLRTRVPKLVGRSAVSGIVACVGAETCRLGLCLSRGLARATAKAIEDAGWPPEILDGVDLRISGCPNSCGQHPVAGLGLFGALRRVDERTVPAYRFTIGGRGGLGSACFGSTLATVPAKAVPAAAVALIAAWRALLAPGENLADTVRRIGTETFKAAVEPFTAIPAWEQDPEAYTDWGAAPEA